MRTLAAITALLAATSAGAQEYRLPFNGRWFVAQGGDTLNVNAHMAVRGQWYGIDFMKVGGPSGGSLVKSTGSTVEDFYSWGEPVLSPVDGEVVAAVDAFPDNPLGVMDAQHPLGNHVEIRSATNRFVFLAHLQHHSVAVRPSERVARGDVLGKCGNSGHTTAPHIHMHVQDAEAFGAGTGQNVEFSGIDVDMSGKKLRNVQWPLIRGLFVSNQ